MKISAIIPAYNSQDFILDAIQSIQNQTHPVDEIIVIDDGSTDNTRLILASKANDIKYIKQKNQGPSAARNTGIKAAQGDWIAFLDADDQWLPDKIEKQLIILEKSPELQLISGDMQEIGINNELITQSVLAKHHQLTQFQNNQSLPIKNALAELVNKNFIPTGTVLVKRATLIEAKLFNTAIRFGEDLELWAKIAAKHPITCLPEILMLRRLHSQNATTSTMPMLIDLVKVMQSIRHYSNDILIAQTIDADKLVANAWANLGYGYFINEQYQQAKSAFRHSLKEKINQRALSYFIACVLPRQIINLIRRTKQALTN
ncbi:MAG: glycosyltransferase family 2 protein [Methyloprofundus sp.]|nr:glycosyltransferase family 2 protein [Methyloprofundus sp.]MDT8426766.1 glycosyltransferase family 2 protein [Methyloprofundus sp.]